MAVFEAALTVFFKTYFSTKSEPLHKKVWTSKTAENCFRDFQVFVTE